MPNKCLTPWNLVMYIMHYFQLNQCNFVYIYLFKFFLLNKSFPTTDDKYFSVGKCFRVDKVSTFINIQGTMVNVSS